jgi:hypothetical protein
MKTTEEKPNVKKQPSHVSFDGPIVLVGLIGR